MMFLFRYIEIGNKIDIMPINNNFKDIDLENKMVLNSSIIDIADIKKQSIHIYIPTYKGNLVRLEKYGYTEFFITIYTSFSPIKFRAKMQKYIKDSISILQIELIGKGEKIQRRRHYRLNTHIEIKIIEIDFDIKEKKESEYKATILDISASGLKISTIQNIKETSKIFPHIILNSIIIAPESKIIKKIYTKESDKKYKYSLEFVNILEESQEEIIKYIFAEQRKRANII